jgi:hypothetical protein
VADGGRDGRDHGTESGAARRGARDDRRAAGASGDRVCAGAVSVLVECEHLAEGQDAFWVPLQPDDLLCRFCWEAAQVLASDAARSSCARPAGDPHRDCVVVAKPVTGLAVHFWLCEACSNADIAEAEALR